MKNLLEELAELEHEQWRNWTKYIANDWIKNGKADWSPESAWIDKQYEKWRKNWKPYQDLTEKEKAKDRIWARKVLHIIERYL